MGAEATDARQQPERREPRRKSAEGDPKGDRSGLQLVESYGSERSAGSQSAVTTMKRNGGCAAEVGGDGLQLVESYGSERAPPSKGFEGRCRAMVRHREVS